jgi:hypothetical protein
MTFSLDEIQRIIGLFALSIGGVYLLGGLTVNLHLSRFGVTEYRLLKAKYLAVGLQFLFSSGFAIVLILVFNLIFPVRSFQDLRIRLNISIIALLLSATVYFSPKFHAWLKQFWTKFLRRKEQDVAFQIWWLMIFGIGLYPVSLALSYNWIKADITNPTYINPYILLALLDIIAGLVLITFYWGIEIYANPVPSGPEAADFIGTGKIQKVQFVGKPEDIELIKQLGIPLETPQRTTELGLLDESEDYYLVLVHKGKEEKAIKIHRDLIKGIAYRGK